MLGVEGLSRNYSNARPRGRARLAALFAVPMLIFAANSTQIRMSSSTLPAERILELAASLVQA